MTNDKLFKVGQQLSRRIEMTNDKLFKVGQQLSRRIEMTNDKLFKVGQQVSHPLFGEGVVVSIALDNPQRPVVVDFSGPREHRYSNVKSFSVDGRYGNEHPPSLVCFEPQAQALLTQYDPWIPVTRSLPEQNAKVPETAMWVQSEEVWVVINHHGNRYIESAILRDGQWSIRNHGGFGWHERVTHWMPKPALPQA